MIRIKSYKSHKILIKVCTKSENESIKMSGATSTRTIS